MHPQCDPRAFTNNSNPTKMMNNKNRMITSVLVLLLLGCTSATTAEQGGRQAVIPEPVAFRPNVLALGEGMPTSQAEGYAPATLDGMTWKFTCAKAYDATEETPEEDVRQFDKTLPFTGNKTETKTLKYYYYKTGANTATVIFWQAVEEDGLVFGDSMYELRLTFADATSGSVLFATCGHGFDYYGSGSFTINTN